MSPAIPPKREDQVAGVYRATRLVGAVDEQAEARGGVGGQHGHRANAEQVVGHPAPSATGPQPQQHGQHHDVDVGQREDREYSFSPRVRKASRT